MRDIAELDEFTQKKFKEITAKDPEDLVEGEKAFIRARSQYLSGDMEKKFAEILSGQTVREPEEEGDSDPYFGKTRKELNTMALEVGVEEPEKLKTNKAVIEAIEANSQGDVE
jgi:hypothetical protein